MCFFGIKKLCVEYYQDKFNINEFKFTGALLIMQMYKISNYDPDSDKFNCDDMEEVKTKIQKSTYLFENIETLGELTLMALKGELL